MAGTLDELGDPVDVDWLRNQLEDQIVFVQNYVLGHMSFAIGKDMSFFQVDAINLIKKYNTANDATFL